MSPYDTCYTKRITNTDNIFLDNFLIQNYHLNKKEKSFSLTALVRNELHKIHSRLKSEEK